MSDSFNITIEEEPLEISIAIQEAADGAPGAPGVSPQLRSNGTALEASEDEGETWGTPAMSAFLVQAGARMQTLALPLGSLSR
jgi:hypothetical protein